VTYILFFYDQWYVVLINESQNLWARYSSQHER